MPIVVAVNGQTEEWHADVSGIKAFPADKDRQFHGYTGGAMFVLSVFCLMFGVGLVAGGFVAYTRREHLSQYTYRLFQ
ncbi:unnamed protein product [Caenorhabditis nigoni]